jgi:hypothetical protein
MAIQSSIQIGEIIQNAIEFNIKNWSGNMNPSDSLIQTVQDFFHVLEERKIGFVLVGGIALLHYVEGRNTQDLDLLMSLASLKKIPELEITHQDLYFARAVYEQLQIKVLLTQNPLFNKVNKKYAKVQHYLDRDIPIVTVEGLILLKLYALPSLYRQGNFARVGIYETDIATLIHAYHPDISALTKELSNYLDENDRIEIDSILEDIQKRIHRFTDETH